MDENNATELEQRSRSVSVDDEKKRPSTKAVEEEEPTIEVEVPVVRRNP